MSVFDEKREATRLLDGLENGGMAADDASNIARDLDPVLVHVIVKFLRETYPASDPAATSVLERVVKMNLTWAGLVAKCRKGEEDPISEWFESEYAFRDFRGRGAEMIALIVEKIDS
jgi:hypothetical protein